ncbi:MAG TPA: AAA family ATPase [Kofleriaceae bacterium]|nr:AAA family ATPase [Kofleriaceae bacterium]
MRHRSFTRPLPFRGNARFELLERIGSGGMGIVYRALDRERGTEVALKTLASASAKGIFRFKQEFRALADVAHPNLVSLHELFFENDQWFFTMELVDGVDFLSHVCGRPAGDGPGVQVDSAMETVVDRGKPRGGAAAAARVVAGMPPLGRAGVGRLRNALRQLVAGITALHESGHLHQDIKPSNVIVTDAGRVVILDFGVVAALAGERRSHDEGEIVGTPAYMAPEQTTDAPPTTASDWYGVGVMLYHALAGRLPFTGSEDRILREKRLVLPSPVRLWRPEVPEDLDRLCMALLDPRPEQRPGGAEVLARVGAADGAEASREGAPRIAVGESELPLVGRERELAALSQARGRVRPGHPVAVHVSGTSGMGKSALVRAFLDEVRRDPRAVVLAGRCYERESVPYKAVDTVVDALCQYLLDRSASEVAAIAPADAALLGTMFPVLRRIEAFAGQVDDELLAAPHRLRRRAFGALRAMLSALAAERPVVIFIDDLQWGDADSAALLDAVLEPPEAPGILLLGCYRREERQRSGFLGRVAGLTPIEVAVEALPADEALAIARGLLAARAGDDQLARALAAESGGNPFFLHELVRFVAVEPGAPAMPSLEALIERRVDRLGADGRGLVEAIAVAGRPIEHRVARVAGGISEGEWPALVQRATAARLLRISGSRNDDLIECYHDRVREAVVDRLAASELARTHRALAVALEDSYRRDPETVAEHFAAAGDNDRAAHYALQAADLAAATLAFDRAASLYRRALELEAPGAAGALVARRQFEAAQAGRPVGDERLAVRVKLAAALVNAGRGAEAAAIYLDAARQSTGDAALELRRLGAEHFLRSGHVDDGMKALAAVLADVGLSLPGSARRSVPALLWRRFRLRLRGLEASAPGALAGSDLARLEVCRTANLGLSLFDPVRAAVFSTRHVHLALDSGDPYRISFALAIEAGFMASAKNPARANQLLARADAIAHEVGHPLLHGSVGMIRAILGYERGDFRDCFLHCERTEELVRRELTGMSWELRTLEMFSIHSLFFLGEFAEILQRVPRHMADARDRGDLYAIMYLRALSGPCTRAIVQDDLPGAEEEIAEVEAQFPGSGFFLQHLFVIYARTFLDLYAGEPERAYRRMQESRPEVRGSMLLHDRSIRAFWTFLLGGTALAAAAGNRRQAPALLRTARRAARALTSDGAAPYAAMGGLLGATVAHLEGKDESAMARLEEAAAGFDAADMKVFAACTRIRLGTLQGGTRGDQLVAEATQALSDRRVVRPERGVLCLAPGFRGGW